MKIKSFKYKKGMYCVKYQKYTTSDHILNWIIQMINYTGNGSDNDVQIKIYILKILSWHWLTSKRSP